jgi:hypothetical protein
VSEVFPKIGVAHVPGNLAVSPRIVRSHLAGAVSRFGGRKKVGSAMIGWIRKGAALLLATAACLYAASAHAQSIVDGSGGDLPDSVRQEIFELVTDDFRDPLSSQFRRLQRGSKPNVYCGEVNTRNMYGAYVGFKPFMVILEPTAKSVDIIPSDDTRPKVSDAEVRAKLQAMKAAGCRFGTK